MSSNMSELVPLQSLSNIDGDTGNVDPDLDLDLPEPRIYIDDFLTDEHCLTGVQVDTLHMFSDVSSDLFKFCCIDIF